MAVRYEINTTPADGEVLLSETMSADWTALQVQIVPLNSSGGHVPLTSGSVSVMVSPFASGDFWIDVNNNNYYGVALRLKVIKSQLPASVASLKVLVWRADTSVPSSQVVAQVFLYELFGVHHSFSRIASTSFNSAEGRRKNSSVSCAT